MSKGGKGGRCVRLTSPPLRAGCHEIWEPKPPGTLWATPGLLRDSFTLLSQGSTVSTGYEMGERGIKFQLPAVHRTDT